MKSESIPGIIVEILNNFRGASVCNISNLSDSEPPERVFGLSNFPCPYQLEDRIYIHTSNKPYVIYCSSYPDNFTHIYVGCHKEEVNKTKKGKLNRIQGSLVYMQYSKCLKLKSSKEERNLIQWVL